MIEAIKTDTFFRMSFEEGEIDKFEQLIKEKYPDYDLVEFLDLILENLDEVLKLDPPLWVYDKGK